MKEYRISPEAFAIASEKIEKLASKAQKLGTPPVKLTVQSYDKVPVKKFDEVVGYKDVLTVTVTGAEPIINGWCFIGSIQHEEAGNLVSLAPGMTGFDVSRFRTGAQRCDHCNTIRRRKDTYLLADLPVAPTSFHEGNIVVGEDNNVYMPYYKQVGSTCLRDFLGWGDPEAVMNYLEAVQQMLGALDAEEGTGGGTGSGRDYRVSLAYFLSHAAAVIDEHGWCSRAKALEEDRPATVELTWSNITLTEEGRRHRHDPEPIVVTAANRELASKTIAWGREVLGAVPVDERSEFDHKLAVLLANDSFEPRHGGILAYAVQAYRRYIGQQAQFTIAPRKQSAHVGRKGERRVFEHLKVVRVFDYPNDYGVSSKHIMYDRDGNCFVWSTGTFRLDEGQTYTVIGTIKDHTEYKGVAQTVITRCKAGLEKSNANG